MKPTSWIALLVVVGLCCGYGRSAIVRGTEGEKPTVGQVSTRAKTTVAGKRTALPEGFPKDVPVYPKATPLISTTIGTTVSVAMKTADSSAQVVAFYKEKLKRSGWEELAKLESDGDTSRRIALQLTICGASTCLRLKVSN